MMQRPVTRATPLMPTQAYRTFAVRSPLSTHHRRATCAEVDCADYINGWYLALDGLPEELLFIAKNAGKRYRQGEVEVSKGVSVKALIFEAGQACFRASTHTKPLERPEFFFAGRGDFRSFSHRKAQQFERADQFVETFAQHLDDLKREIEKG